MTPEALVAYLQPFIRRPHALLTTLEADAAARGVPIIGPWEAQTLTLLARSVQARRVLELGTATGYSAIWLALAVAPWGGQVVTIEQSAARVREAQDNLQRAGVQTHVQLRQGAALDVLPGLPEQFDLIFNDILWYVQSVAEAQRLLTACRQRLRPGGLLVCDNALRGGSILPPTPEAAALGVKAFTEALLQDSELDTALLPIRDGLLVCRRHMPSEEPGALRQVE
jgi:predicted O-methyltransferase YrrM